MWTYDVVVTPASVSATGLDQHSDSETKVPPPVVRVDTQQMNGMVDDRGSESSTDILVCFLLDSFLMEGKWIHFNSFSFV